MNKIVLLSLAILLLSGCVSLDSVVEKNLKTRYTSPLIVIPYEQRTEKIALNLKSQLQKVFSMNSQRVSVLTLMIEKPKLELNAISENEQQLREEMEREDIDLVIYFKPNELYYVNGGLQTATYILIGTDLKTKREVWKANYKAQGGAGPASLAKKSASKIFLQLKEDGVL